MRVLFTTFVVFTWSLVGAQTGNQPLTLQECIQYALDNNPQLKNAQLNVDAANLKVGEIVASGLPQINASADLSYNFKVPTSFIPAEFFGGEAGTFAPVQFSPAYNGNAGVSVNQMIFNGSYFVGLKASKTYTELSRRDKIKTEIDVIEAVSKAYYLALINKERADLLMKNYGRLDSLFRETTALYNNGFVEKLDVDRVKVQVNNLAVEKNNIFQIVELSLSLLKFQMGLDVNQPIQLKDRIEDIQFQALTDDFGSDFKTSDRIEFALLETNSELVKLDIQNTQSQYMPSIDLYATMGSSTGAGSTADLFNFSDRWFGLGVVGLQVRMPIFDGLRKSKQVQQKKVQAKQLELSKDQVKRSIDLEIKQARTNLKRNVDNLTTQKENSLIAESIFRVAKVKYENGVGSSLEIVNADADLKTAQSNYYDALYNALVTKIDLEKALGKITPLSTQN
jgi:outer membrane protein